MYAIIKRFMDIAGGGLGLLLTGLLLPFIALAIKLDSPGPVFFYQPRLTKGRRAFRFYKFRTMVLTADLDRKALEQYNEKSGPIFKMKNDPRVTRVGRFLRSSSLDELPQFWNVLTGDMSLVGPRPPLVHEIAGYEDWQLRRLEVKTGLTGLWQVSGRSRLDFYRMTELDIQYIDHPSPWLDVKILFRTAAEMFRKRGAY
jgi:lipopolysaccharide/colanic/teichoic acid biosynthesis glycosyltransferase